MLCMEDRKKAFEVASDMGMNYYTSLAFHWLDNIPKPEGPAGVAGEDPRAHARSRSRSCRPRATSSIGDPDDCAKRHAQVGRTIGFDQLTFSPTTNTLAHRRGGRLDGAVRPRGASRSSTRTRCTRPPATGPKLPVCPRSSLPDRQPRAQQRSPTALLGSGATRRSVNSGACHRLLSARPTVRLPSVASCRRRSGGHCSARRAAATS